LPDGFLSHANIGDHFIDLGSWYDRNMPVLCKVPVTAPIRLTPMNYDELYDLETACSTHFGNGAGLGDWNDVVDAFDAYGKSFVNELGLAGTTTEALVRRDGERWYSSTRHYFIARHDGDLPDGFLSHANIGDHFIDLGSWYDRKMPALCLVDGDVIFNDGFESGDYKSWSSAVP